MSLTSIFNGSLIFSSTAANSLALLALQAAATVKQQASQLVSSKAQLQEASAAQHQAAEVSYPNCQCQHELWPVLPFLCCSNVSKPLCCVSFCSMVTALTSWQAVPDVPRKPAGGEAAQGSDWPIGAQPAIVAGEA